MITVKKLIKILKKLGYNINIVAEKDFIEKIKEKLQDENSNNMINSLLNDMDRDLHLDYKSDIIIKSKFTVKYLKKNHCKWPRISKKYLTRYTNLMRKVI